MKQNFKRGDRVRIVDDVKGTFEIGEIATIRDVWSQENEYERKNIYNIAIDARTFCVSDSVIELIDGVPVKWRDMTDEEKGALLLARHERRKIEKRFGTKWIWVDRPKFFEDDLYRIAHEPEVVTVQKCYGINKYGILLGGTTSHEISYKVVDGEVDCDSFEVRKL